MQNKENEEKIINLFKEYLKKDRSKTGGAASAILGCGLDSDATRKGDYGGCVAFRFLLLPCRDES